MTPLLSMHLKQHADWLELFIAWSEPLSLFPIYKPRTVKEHHSLFHCTQNRQLEHREKQVATFDNKCIALELETTPLTPSWPTE